jgi:eukaryotic-like serine/threonine-protein kinase
MSARGRRRRDAEGPEHARIDASLDGFFRDDADRSTEVAAAASPLDPALPTYLFAEASAAPARPKPPPAAQSERTSRARDALRPGAPLLDALPLGGIIDKYRLEEVIGTGGFAVVYRATHLLLQRPVALKLLRAKLLERRPELAQRLCEEARYAARINHPNVVRVFDVTHNANITYLVLEYIEGRTLAQRIKSDGRLPAIASAAIALDVVRGLRAGLEQGLIHRDIKPHNILLSAGGETKIVDLGLARPTVISPDEPHGRSSSVVGTYGYMAPEQAIAPERVDFRADIYSLGATMFHAATGRPPFPTDDTAACLRLHATAPVPAMQDFAPEAPRVFSELVRWMLSKEPAQRPASYDVLEASLLQTQAEMASREA